LLVNLSGEKLAWTNRTPFPMHTMTIPQLLSNLKSSIEYFARLIVNLFGRYEQE
jgi:hypothetical protein